VVARQAGDLAFPLIYFLHGGIFKRKFGGIMKKLSIVLASFLFVAGFISIAWAHGPKGSGSGYRGHSYSKPHFSRPSYPRIHLRHNQHYRHQRHKGHKGHNKHYLQQRHKGHNKHYRHQSHQRPNQHYRHKNHRRHHRYYRPYYGPYGRYYDFDYGYGDDPPIEESPQVPQHTPSSQIYYNNNPEPWFLYGKGKEFRQMGLIPPLPQTSQGLR
jgi:hypothetical protein